MPKQINTLPAGALVKDTTSKFYDQPIVWKIADKNHSGYPANSVTLITEKILSVRSADGKEAANTDSNRVSYGNNRYIHTNLRQWLNSAAGAGAWYAAQHSADAPPNATNTSYNPYDTQAGFLSGFSTNFRNALLATQLTVVKATVDGGGSEIVTDKVFLASTTEVGLANEGGTAEGVIFPIFSDNASRIAYPTANAVSNSNYTNTSFAETKGWYWWLRTPYSSDSYDVRNVTTTGALSNNFAYYGNYGVRPLCNLNSSILVSDTTDADGAYTIIWNRPPEISGADGDIGVKTENCTYSYSVTDPDYDSVTVTEQIDGATIRTYAATLGLQYTAVVDGNDFAKLAQGSHTLTITAKDAYGETAVRKITFTKQINKLSVTLTEPLPAAEMPTRININITAQIPVGAGVKVEVCNNGYDSEPVWEDATEAALARRAYVFENKNKIAANWGVNIKVNIERRTAIGECYLTGIGGNFE